jgi:hypothetical protein
VRKKEGGGCKEEEGEGDGTRLERVMKKECTGCKEAEGDGPSLEGVRKKEGSNGM